MSIPLCSKASETKFEMRQQRYLLENNGHKNIHLDYKAQAKSNYLFTKFTRALSTDAWAMAEML